MEVPLKTKNRGTIWPRNPTPGYMSGENHGSKGYIHPDVHCSAVYNTGDKEAIQMSIDRGMDKEDAVYI